jgi:phosphoribosyl 1,2-cyclic phosphodiesterase
MAICSFGYRIDDFAYLTDVKTIEDIEIAKLLKVLVVNALREEAHNTHFNLEEALNFIALVKPDKAYAYKSPLGFMKRFKTITSQCFPCI